MPFFSKKLSECISYPVYHCMHFDIDTFILI